MDPTNQGEGLGSYVSGTSSGSQLTGSGLPMGEPSSEERTMAMLAHVGAAAGALIGLPFLAPLIIYFAKAKESAFIRFHAVESLNLQITSIPVYIVGIILAVVTCGIGAFLLPVIPIGIAVLNVIAGMKANEGQTYSYPVPMLRLIK